MIAKAKKELTYEQLAPALHKWAYKLCSGRFEPHELMNAVWAMGRVQQLPSIKLAMNRVHYDMLEYMRDGTKETRRGRYAINKGQFWPSVISLDQPRSHGDKVDNFGKILQAPENGLKEVERKDLCEWLLWGCSRREKLIIALYYQKNFSMYEIGKIIGIGTAMVSLNHKALLGRLKDKLLKQCA